MKFATVIYTQDVRSVLEFYQRAFGIATRFCDDAYKYGELDVDGAILGIASHSLGELVMPAVIEELRSRFPLSSRTSRRPSSRRWPRDRGDRAWPPAYAGRVAGIR